jgi:TorA maturation chaperone TorD
VAALGDLFQCLSQSLQPPAESFRSEDWCGLLAQDLQDLSRELGLDLSAEVAALTAASTDTRLEDIWLVEYSRLFLVPPVPVTLNTGLYLEGGLGGTTAQMLVQCYESAGFKPSENFHDLPDHAAMQLEFVASLYQRAASSDEGAADLADEFLETFVMHWAAPFESACVKASEKLHAALVYQSIARALSKTIEKVL